MTNDVEEEKHESLRVLQNFRKAHYQSRLQANRLEDASYLVELTITETHTNFPSVTDSLIDPANIETHTET